jgi:DNA invertase Pin-like site-specific DNA recombinase
MRNRQNRRPSPKLPSAVPLALTYRRVSSDEQAREGVSMDAQSSECTRYVAGHGWQLGDDFTDVLTGTRDDRPGYQALLERVRELATSGQSVVLVVAQLDRLGRRLMERLRCRHELRELGVAVHSVRDGGEVTDLQANIMGSVAEEEVRLIGERTHHAFAHIAEQGWFKPGGPPFGYRWRERSPAEQLQGAPEIVIEPKPAAADVVRMAFEQVALGASARSVHRMLKSLPGELRGTRAGRTTEKRGLALVPATNTPRLRKHNQERHMSWRAVLRMLRSPVYVGRLTADGPVARFPAIVDEGTWQAVQARLDGHQRRARQASNRYMLSGILRCATCGQRMSGAQTPRLKPAPGRPGILRYRCRGNDLVGGTACHQTADARKIDALVLDQVGTLVESIAEVFTALPIAAHEQWATLSVNPLAAANERRAEQLRQHITLANGRIGRATIAKIDGEIEQDAYVSLCSLMRGEIATATTELEHLSTEQRRVPARLPSLDELGEMLASWQQVLAGTDVTRQRGVLDDLLESVVPHRISHGRYRVELTWSTLGAALQKLNAADLAA